NFGGLHDIRRQEGHDFLVMEHLEGDTLAARIERGALEWEEALQIAIGMADALDKAHRRGVVHRDLKPSNVILTASGPKLLDFGLAKWTGTFLSRDADSAGVPATASRAATVTNLTAAGTIMGTLQYMAPEQLEGMD